MNTVTVTRCPCGTDEVRPVTDPCPACDRMVPGQAAPERVELAARTPAAIDGAFPHTSAILTAGLAKGQP